MHKRFKQRIPRPRIAMVSTHGYVAAEPPLGALDTGGQVVYVLELSKELARQGHLVDIWTRRFEDQPEIEFVAEGVRIVRAPCGGQEFIPKEFLYKYLPEWIENFSRFIEKHQLSYQFINSHYWDAGVAAQEISESLGIPHIHTPHSLGLWKKQQLEAEHPGDERKLEEQYNFAERIRYEREIYASAELVVATSGPQKDLLLNEYDVAPQRCRLLPPGYDANRFFPVGEDERAELRQRVGFTKPVVMAMGRLAFNKGYDLLIQAFDFVAKRDPDPVLYLAIGGETETPQQAEMTAELKSLASELGIEDRVHFGTFIPDHELADYYRAADVFVLSSRYEPFGMTALESMACGTPTVITTQGGLYRAITFGRHALYADPFDREELGVMMLKALKDERLRSRISRLGAARAGSKFSWTTIAKGLTTMAKRIERPGVQVLRAG